MKTTQARVVHPCVESGNLFDCTTRTWYQKDTATMDRRGILVHLEQIKEQLLRLMQQKGKTIQDVINDVKSLRENRSCTENGRRLESRMVRRAGRDG